MKFISVPVRVFVLSIAFAGFGSGQTSLTMDRKQAKEEIKVIKSRIQDWAMPNEYYKINDEKALEDVILFINDPVDRFDSIKYLNTHELWQYIGMYDDVLKGSKGIGTFFFFGRLEKEMIPVDSRKVKLVTYLLHDREPDGVYAELMVDIYIKSFETNPQLFVDDLKTRSDWKDVIGNLASGDYDAMTAGLKELGSTKFEMELKEYWTEFMKGRRTTMFGKDKSEPIHGGPIGSCCKDLSDCIKQTNPLIWVDQNGTLFLTISYMQTEQGVAWFDHAVIYCPFCGVKLQDRKVLADKMKDK